MFGNSRPQGRSWPEVGEWARSRGWTLRGVRDVEGFVIDGSTGADPWRLEWGPSQRSYIDGPELRLRAELDVPRELQVLVLDRTLMEAMERSVFEQYVEDVQTRIDTETPAEMRWLVMYPKLAGAELKSLREGWGAVASSRHWLRQWLEGSLSTALGGVRAAADQPLVLMVGRRRLSLRTALPDPDVPLMQRWLRLFECALREARRVDIDAAQETEAPTTQPGLFPGTPEPALPS